MLHATPFSSPFKLEKLVRIPTIWKNETHHKCTTIIYTRPADSRITEIIVGLEVLLIRLLKSIIAFGDFI